MVNAVKGRLYFFFFNDTSTTEIYTLSLHDALPISPRRRADRRPAVHARAPAARGSRPSHRAAQPGRHSARRADAAADRKSTRLNSSHLVISYAVFCLQKKNLL